MYPFILHLSIALTWLFLSGKRDLPSLFIGLVIGYFLLRFFQSLLNSQSYLRRLNALGFWLLKFLQAFFLAQYRVARAILGSREHFAHAGFFEFSIEGLNDAEILVLSHSITLTPGTTTVDVDPQKRFLLIHAMDNTDTEGTKQEIREQLLEPLLRVTR